MAMGRAVLMAGLGTPGAADFDVREALAAVHPHPSARSKADSTTRPVPENLVVAANLSGAFRKRSPIFAARKPTNACK